MDDDVKYGRETMNKVLGWGTIVYFLVLGFSLSQHALFEWSTSEQQTKLENAKLEYAKTIETVQLSKDQVEAAKLKADAAQARLDVRILQDESRDGHLRARNLIIGIVIFGGFYVFAIPIFYYLNITRLKAKYFISIWLATLYGLILGGVTIYAAVQTAIY